MFIAECDSDEIKREASNLLKSLGIKHRFKKFDFKSGDKKETVGVFKIRIERLKKKKVKLHQYDHPVSVPTFLVDSCDYLRDRIDTEGLFRKPGVAIRQKELKQMLVSGRRLTAEREHNVTDVADLLKQFFRDLPEPCIPYVFHDILQRCLDSKERQKEAISLCLLLLPQEYLYTLAYLMQFLREVAAHWESNRMDVCNLAIVWTPNLMPFKTGQVNDKHALDQRLAIVQMLIENSASIGEVPESLYEHLVGWQPSCSVSSLDCSRQREKKKKRRSGSLTRMLSGIKKMVTRSESDEVPPIVTTPEHLLHTPCIMSTGKKRKASDSTLPVFSAKKRRDLLECLPQGALLPDICPTHLTPRVLVAQPAATNGRAGECQQKRKSRFYTCSSPQREDRKKSQRSLSGSKLRLSHFGLGKKHKKKSTVTEDSGLELSATPNTLDLTSASDDFVRISRSEYEDIKNRVSRIESRISSELENIVGVSMSDIEMTPERSEVDSLKTVQSAYEKTLVSAEKLNSPTSDELAKRFSRELKIRGSSEKKVIRSPSARKIGSLRRRSKENAPNIKRNLSLNVPDRFASRQFYPFNTLRRGKPNTVCNGLPGPLLVSTNKTENQLESFTSQLKSESFECQRESSGVTFDLTSFGVLTRSQARRASSFHSCDLSKVQAGCSSTFTPVQNVSPVEVSDWTDAEVFLNEEKVDTQAKTGRPSLAKLRSQNAGMVLAKAKLFNTMVDPESVKAFKTSKTSNGKPQELKKRNSSKSSKERRLHRKDSRSGGRKGKKENSNFRNPSEPTLNPSTEEATCSVSKREHRYTANGKENVPNNRMRFAQNSLPKTPQIINKTVENRYKECTDNCPTPRNQSSQVVSPLRERNRYNTCGSGRQPVSRCPVIRNTPKVSSSGRSTPSRAGPSTPRRSPRQLLLKSRNLPVSSNR